jgi:Domain of unknown function (DUF4326)
MTPWRIRLSRAPGWRKPAGAIVVARGTPDGNPFTVKSLFAEGFTGTAGEARKVCAERFRAWLLGQGPDVIRAGKAAYDRRRILARMPRLRGKVLACWCPLTDACHADVLYELASQTEVPSGT